MSERAWLLLRDLSIGLVVGAFSGLFGVGGGVLLVPILVLAFHVAQKPAQATSLVVVALAATTGAVTYAVGDSVVWSSVGFLLAGGFVGTWLGSAIVVRIQTRWLQLMFGVLLVVAAIRLVVVAGDAVSTAVVSLGPWVIVGYVLSGFAMGLLSSLLGIGGGIIVIPLLIAFFGFTQQLAAGTSLVVMVPIALLGAWRLTRSGHTQWGQGTRIGVAASVGAIGGASLALVANAAVMQAAFGVVMVFAASQMLWKAFRGPATGQATTSPD
jgi:uncharacterized membrane protein YfcA